MKNQDRVMKLTLQKIKLYVAMFCIGSMAFLIGVPIVPQEKIDKILQANNLDTAAEVIQASDEQL